MDDRSSQDSSHPHETCPLAARQAASEPTTERSATRRSQTLGDAITGRAYRTLRAQAFDARADWSPPLPSGQSVRVAGPVFIVDLGGDIAMCTDLDEAQRTIEPADVTDVVVYTIDGIGCSPWSIIVGSLSSPQASADTTS